MKKTTMFVVALWALPFAVSPAVAATSKIQATLVGGGTGDPAGQGRFSAELDTEYGDFCYHLSVSKVKGATKGRIEEVGGKKLSDLVLTGADEDACIALQPDEIEQILAKPQNYRIVVVSGDYRNGAVSGQVATTQLASGSGQ